MDAPATVQRLPTPADLTRFASYLAFYRDGASMSARQWREHLREPAFCAWLRTRGLSHLII